MNDVQRKLLENKVKNLCKDLNNTEIDELTGFMTKPNLKICATCVYFLAAEVSPFDDFIAACVFGCVRPQTPIGYCKAFKGR